VVLPDPLWPTAATIKTVFLRAPPHSKASVHNKLSFYFGIMPFNCWLLLLEKPVSSAC
jgi:hypothetical protein